MTETFTIDEKTTVFDLLDRLAARAERPESLLSATFHRRVPWLTREGFVVSEGWERPVRLTLQIAAVPMPAEKIAA